jgi:multisubunit Na+/H+ antiporter MnhG subunit
MAVTIRTISADVLLGFAAAVVLAASVGILIMRDVYQKLHYVTPVALVAPVVVGAAVGVQSGLSIITAQTWLVLLLIAVAGPFLTHATIRAARIREKGDWRLGKGRDGGPDGDRR